MDRRALVPCRHVTRLTLVAALALLLAFAAACGGSSSSGTSPSASAAGTPQKGGTLVISYQSEPQSLDPAINWDEGWTEEDCLYATFLKYASGPGAAGTKLIPALAESLPEVSADGTTYTFHLRKDIRFAPPVDRAVTAEDFKWSFERMMKLPLAPATSFYTEIAGAPAFMAGTAIPISQIYPAGLPGHVEGSAGEFYGYDPAKAKQLLTQAGYANGFTTTLYTHNVDPWPRLMQSIQNDLAQVGITASIKTMDRGTYWTLIGQPGKVPAGFMVWRQDYPDPSDFILPLFSKAAAVPGGFNASFWWDPRVESLVAEAQRMTAPDQQQERLAKFQEAQRIIMDQAPAVPLYQPVQNSMFSKRVGGFYLSPVTYYRLPDYWIK
jgi:ABC-type transport system substrate-binding protein